MKTVFRIIACVVLILLVASCTRAGGTPTQTPTAVVQSTATVSPTPTAVVQPTATVPPTPTPTAVVQPTATTVPTPTPTAVPQPTATVLPMATPTAVAQPTPTILPTRTPVVILPTPTIPPGGTPQPQTIQQTMPIGGSAGTYMAYSRTLQSGEIVYGSAQLMGQTQPRDTSWEWRFQVMGPSDQPVVAWTGNWRNNYYYPFTFAAASAGTYRMVVTHYSLYQKQLLIQVTPSGWAYAGP